MCLSCELKVHRAPPSDVQCESAVFSGSARVETSTKVKTGDGYSSEGVSGLKALGVRDLNYRLSFLACSVQSSKAGVSV